MGLFWSATRDNNAGEAVVPMRAAVARVPPPEPWILTAETDGRVVATDTVWQRVMNPDVRVVPVRDSGIVGVAYFPPDSGPHPAVIVIGGSNGGIVPPRGAPGGLASRGYVALSLGYFGVQGLPDLLREIPLEYFERAIQWLARQPGVDSTRLAIFGTSRGAEAALLIGATYPSVKLVVANVPSHVVWPGLVVDNTRASAWTLGGKPVPYMDNRPLPRDVARQAGCFNFANCPQLLGYHAFLAMLEDRGAQERAAIPVERINGPILLISAKEDRIWPSAMMAGRIVERLKSKKFAHPVESYSYDNAGHYIGRPYVSTRGVDQRTRHPISGVVNMAGGTPEGTAVASEDAWAKTLEFLARYLAKPDAGSRP
jgi:dienelactone hydrolase